MTDKTSLHGFSPNSLAPVTLTQRKKSFPKKVRDVRDDLVLLSSLMLIVNFPRRLTTLSPAVGILKSRDQVCLWAFGHS